MRSLAHLALGSCLQIKPMNLVLAGQLYFPAGLEPPNFSFACLVTSRETLFGPEADSTGW